MNFKYLFNNNFTDNRLLQKMPNYEAEAQMFQEQQELEHKKQQQQIQQQINQISQQGRTARGLTPETIGVSSQKVQKPNIDWSNPTAVSKLYHGDYSGVQGNNESPVIAPTSTPKFDPDSGKTEAYNQQLNAYLKEYFSNRGYSKRRDKKAREYFDRMFNYDWNANAGKRKAEFEANARALAEIDAKALEKEKGLKPELKLEPKLKTAGLNFGSVKDVQTWLTNNGFDTKGIDNIYGANTRNAINNLLNDSNFGLTDAEKQKFRDFQNSTTFYKAKARNTPLITTPKFQGGRTSEVVPPISQNVAAFGLQVQPIILGLSGSYKDVTPTFFAPGQRVERKEGDLYIDESGNLVSSVQYNPRNNTQAKTQPKSPVYTAEYLRENSPYFRDKYGTNVNAFINGKNYPVLVSKDLIQDDTYDKINDRSYAYDENTGKILRLNESIFGWPMFSEKGNAGWVDVNEFVQDPLKFYGKKKNGGTINKYKQGNKMNNEQELQKAFMVYLIEDAATQGVQIQSEQDLQAYAQQLGKEGLKVKYQEFMQKMRGQEQEQEQGVKAALGTKLNYIRKIKGMCPDGEETYFFKEGGSIKSGCKPCMAKVQKGQELKTKGNAIQDFKDKRKHINESDTVHTKYGIRDLNGNTKYPKWNPKKENYTTQERQRVVEKDWDSSKKIKVDACGGKAKKKK